MASVNIGGDGQEQAYDEIKNFLTCRYVCPPEAILRMPGFSMHGYTFSVLQLTVHLDGDACIFFGETDSSIEERLGAVRKSTLTAWICLNAHHGFQKNGVGKRDWMTGERVEIKLAE